MTLLAGKYELVRPLGQGGMAEVWEAVLHGDAGFRRRVAVKRMAAERVGDERLQRMFVDEARLASRLHHPNLVAVIDFGIVEGVAFQVLELVDGLDAARLASLGSAAHQPMPAPVALGIAATVGHALHAAHTAVGDDGAALGVVHRDVSPQNVLVSRAGDVKLADFGIALWEQRTEKTIGAASRGKPTYMAPEQAMRSGGLDARADVFSLGCTLHALLTGESAMKDENALVDLLAGLELDADASLPAEVRELIGRAVRRDRQARHPTAEAFAQACERVQAALAPPGFELRRALKEWMALVVPASAPRLPTPTPSGRPSVHPSPAARRARVLGLVGAVVALGVASIVARQWPGPAAPPSAPGPAVTAPAEPAVQPADSPREVAALPVEPARSEARPRRALPAPAPAAPKAMGVLAIGGERLLKGEIFVDGRPAGFAPRQLELPTGAHQVELVLTDGTRLGPRVITVSAQHTESAPQRWVE
ncbi:MAG: serine/threonine protein kinase [Myxococcaceae bacterium]|nr:serine/threonine protein kinase [Myxococcaceae bacterium]